METVGVSSRSTDVPRQLCRVMLLTSSLTGGGAERVIANLVRTLDRSHFAVTVAHLKERGEIGDELAAEGHEVVAVPRSAGPGRYVSFRGLASVVRARRIQVVHTHTTYALTDGALCRLAMRGRLGLLHTFHFGNYPHLPFRYRLMEHAASRVAGHLVAVGVEQMNTLQALYRLPPGRIRAILNGTDAPPPAPDPEWAARLQADRRVVVGTTATFIEQKGLDYLLEVADLLRRRQVAAVFVVVGDGPLRPQLEAQCAARGLQEMVHFAGWKRSADRTMTPLYDVLFQPSRWEAMSVVVLEAMAAGKPVVATDVGDNRHVIVDGVTGFVVPAHDVDSMADRLADLVESPALRQRFGAEGRCRHEARYTAAVMTRSYEDLYTSLAARPAAPVTATTPGADAAGRSV
jgi:glycosyltransferase involved in cell wall biosynthesis